MTAAWCYLLYSFRQQEIDAMLRNDGLGGRRFARAPNFEEADGNLPALFQPSCWVRQGLPIV